MKSRAIALALMVSLCVLLPGCARTYFVRFIDNHSIADWVKSGDYSVSGLGLEMDDEGIVTSPVAFNGDFDVTVVFELHVNTTTNRAAFAIWLSDSQAPIPNNHITNFGRGLGNPSDEEYGVQDYCVDDATHPYVVNLDAEFPNLNRDGDNTWRLFKEGSHVLITMNGTETIADFNITHYDGVMYFVNLHGDISGAGVLSFKSVKVVYYDDILDG